MAELEFLKTEALKLAPGARARLAERLLESLDALSPEEIEELWADEAERRVAEHRAGRTKTIPAEEVFAKAFERVK